ncbi:MAG: DUF1841 family protein [Gammaproteobacteria bacterium]|nr:DUF1841 family protein [Gammaproteobacteria bacterium]
MFNADRTTIRRFFCETWNKHRTRQPLEPLERLIADVIAQHPEYHAQLEQTEAVLERDFPGLAGDGNPFMHLGMHIAIREQLSTDRPPGVLGLYQRLCQRLQDPHKVQHSMMDCLGETLWEAQRTGGAPDEARYLQKLQNLLQNC